MNIFVMMMLLIIVFLVLTRLEMMYVLVMLEFFFMLIVFLSTMMMGKLWLGMVLLTISVCEGVLGITLLVIFNLFYTGFLFKN
uniref:NADH dehydrogenase subunit 4L n=1 Tax=Polycarpa mytiligera TaxID=569436 RepID=S0DFD7_POLMY|nr:NADH dehydrogenase subunit 4L [Polycarpa mytiligera]CCO25751.1 NADH dehydrogenase subunit 4L [Polycarpa mytiligera]